MAADLLSSCLTSSVMGNQGKYKIYFDFFGFFISLPELRSMHVELYILKSKFGCHVPESNLSYCHVNLAGDGQRSTHWFRYAHISESPTNIVKCLKSNILDRWYCKKM